MRTQTKPRCCWEELCRCRLPLAAPPRPYLCYLIAITSAARRSSRGVPCPAIRGLHTLLTQYLGIPKLCVFATHFILVHTRAVKSKIYQLPLLRVLNLPLLGRRLFLKDPPIFMTSWIKACVNGRNQSLKRLFCLGWKGYPA